MQLKAVQQHLINTIPLGVTHGQAQQPVEEVDDEADGRQPLPTRNCACEAPAYPAGMQAVHAEAAAELLSAWDLVQRSILTAQSFAGDESDEGDDEEDNMEGDESEDPDGGDLVDG